MKKYLQARILKGIVLLVLCCTIFTSSFSQNNACGSAPVLTPGPTCTTTAGTLAAAATFTVTPGLPGCGVANDDVFYRFTAQSSITTVALSGISAALSANIRLQLLGGSCAAPTSLFCGSTSVVATGLTPGDPYWIRIYSTTNATGNFNICVTSQPANDSCVTATSILANPTCGKTMGTIVGAKPSNLAWSCGVAGGVDVWYSFVAETANTTINTNDFGANFTNRRLQLFSGTCGSLTSLFCVTTNSLSATGLIPGNTYYIRFGSTTTTPIGSQGDFSICVQNEVPPQRHGNSYVNISKRSVGGVVQNGDTLEIRMTINVVSGTCLSPRYVANVPTNTVMLSGTGDSIRIITNEGLTFRRYTPLAGDDAGSYVASPPAGQFNIRLNLGLGATAPGTPANNTQTEIASATGQLIAAGAANKPRGGGGMLFATSFRVRVTGAVGDTINLGTSRFVYRLAAAGPDIVLSGEPYKILISAPMSLCTGSIGINSAEESGGTFGLGNTVNRSTDLITPIPGYTYVNSGPLQGVGDGQYSVVNNMSPYSGTNRLAERTPTCPTGMPSQNSCTNRMHGGHWDIDGDHTGTNNAIGNIPPAAGVNSGYMLMVNADYVASETYRQSLGNLCPNTYYEFSAWLRNICPTCGIDSTGTTYSPRRPGVLPNLTFSLDTVDRYSTGEVTTAVGWVKKGFVFITDSTQQDATFVIRNNSQGGGGNDWVIDDITVATCLPQMRYSPSMNPNVCRMNPLTIDDTIRTFFNNYVYYKWQRSTNGGGSWTDVTAPLGPATPFWNGTAWQYVTSYTIPPSATDTSDNGDLYRVIVATTLDNLSSADCMATDGVSIISLSVTNCGVPLKTDLISFNGKLMNERGNLSWTTSKEDEPITFTLERSADGNNFNVVSIVNSHNNYTAAVNSYSYVDPTPITGKAFYRLVMTDQSGMKKYSRTIQLTRQANDGFGLVNVINPFNHTLEFDVTSPSDTKIDVELIDLFGKVVQKNSFTVHSGINALSIPNTEKLPAGTYIFRIKNNQLLINKKVLKQSY